MKFTYLGFVSLFFAVNLASAQEIVSTAIFANNLEEIRGECSTMASELSADAALADTKNSSESYLRRLKTRQDVELYAIGHGRRQTVDYQLERMRADSEADANERQQIVAKRDEGSAAVRACIEKAVEKGKTLYSGVKRNKQIEESATQLMTSWLVNTRSVSFYSPSGSQDSNNDWKKAKAAAELSGL